MYEDACLRTVHCSNNVTDWVERQSKFSWLPFSEARNPPQSICIWCVLRQRRRDKGSGPNRRAGWELNPFISQEPTPEVMQSIYCRGQSLCGPWPLLKALPLNTATLETRFQCVLEGTLSRGVCKAELWAPLPLKHVPLWSALFFISCVFLSPEARRPSLASFSHTL